MKFKHLKLNIFICKNAKTPFQELCVQRVCTFASVPAPPAYLPGAHHCYRNEGQVSGGHACWPLSDTDLRYPRRNERWQTVYTPPTDAVAGTHSCTTEEQSKTNKSTNMRTEPLELLC